MNQFIFWLAIATLIFIAINRHLYSQKLEDDNARLKSDECAITRGNRIG